MENIYFALTKEFNKQKTIAILASGQATVFYRVAIMSKDGDWILLETEEACEKVLGVLAKMNARYRPCAPLDVRWLSGGWSSHFEFFDERSRRVRCDFFTRPPRVGEEALKQLFLSKNEKQTLSVVDIESLISMKRTQRMKDYAVIAELAKLLDKEHEIQYTTDPDRIISLAAEVGSKSSRPCVLKAIAGEGREEIAVAITREINSQQEADRRRLKNYDEASRNYLREFNRLKISQLPLLDAHTEILKLAEKLLPFAPIET